jgi:hypothetical protein
MLKIEIKQGEEKIPIPLGIYVNGYIINAPVCTDHRSMVQLEKVMVIQPNKTTTPIKENEDGDT